MYLPECIKMVITPLVIDVFIRNLDHCIQHTWGYQSMPKIQFFEKFSMIPFIAGHNYYYYIIREIRSDCVIGTWRDSL